MKAGPDARQRGLAESQAVENGGYWVVSTPGEAGGVRLSSQEWVALLRFRVGAKISACTMPCPLCGVAADAWGDHRLGCAKCGLTADTTASAIFWHAK